MVGCVFGRISFGRIWTSVGCVFGQMCFWSDLFRSDVDFGRIGFRSDRLLVGSDFGRIDFWSDVFRSDRRGRIDAGRSVVDPSGNPF